VKHGGSRTLLAGCAVLACAASACAASAQTAWPDTFTARLEALALLQTLNAELLSHDSATLTLDRWCAAHHLASPAQIVAEQVPGADKPLPDDQRQVLAIGAGEPVRYRRVRLLCGTHVLSEADNWYVPGRLTPEMNHALETTNAPFGRVVAPLHFGRRTLSATLLWRPLPDGWDMGAAPAPDGGGALQIPAEVLQHRAVLALPDGTPFSAVVETYTREVLGFPAPNPR
jgi:hypothetical protein